MWRASLEVGGCGSKEFLVCMTRETLNTWTASNWRDGLVYEETWATVGRAPGYGLRGPSLEALRPLYSELGSHRPLSPFCNLLIGFLEGPVGASVDFIS